MPFVREEVHLVLLGPPASGKGTQGRRLAEWYGADYFSMGRQLRQEMEQGTFLGEQARRYLEKGQYVPDSMAIELATSWLNVLHGGWILDGFPRTLSQASVFDDWLEDASSSLRAVILEGAFEVFLDRVRSRYECSQCSWIGTESCAMQAGLCPGCGAGLRKREDDEESNFRARWGAFEELTKPLADYYVKSHRLLRVSSEGSPDEVFERIRSGLEV